jgi:hypothetical protein
MQQRSLLQIPATQQQQQQQHMILLQDSCYSLHTGWPFRQPTSFFSPFSSSSCSQFCCTEPSSCALLLLLRCSLCLSLFLPSLHQHHLMKKIVLNGEGIGMLKPDWFHSFSEWESIMIACLIDWWSYTLANRIECCKS